MKSSIQPRKQRFALHNSPLHKRGKQLHAHLSEELLVKWGKRSTSVRVGDTVKVVRGRDAGTSGEVLSVDRVRFAITIEGVSVAKADGKSKPKPVHPSDVILTKLDLTDKRRREKLGASEADAESSKPKPKPAKAKAASPKGGSDAVAPDTDPRARAAAKTKAKAEEAVDEDEEESQ